MFRSVIPAVLAVALTACGGGGGGGGGSTSVSPAPSVQLASPMLGNASKHRSAIVDLRFDQSTLAWCKILELAVI